MRANVLSFFMLAYKITLRFELAGSLISKCPGNRGCFASLHKLKPFPTVSSPVTDIFAS